MKPISDKSFADKCDQYAIRMVGSYASAMVTLIQNIGLDTDPECHDINDFDNFIDELSNWYIRRNRRRFWKSEDDQDKFTAYATLYHVLVNSIKCVAPVLPFCTEKMYENLVLNLNPEAPESVHLCDYPSFDANLIDEDIIQKVDSLKRVVELGRSARNQSKVKIRQPLLKVLYAIEDNKTSEFIRWQKEYAIRDG